MEQDVGSKTAVEERLEFWNRLRVLVKHPTAGMAKKGFSDTEIEAAEDEIDKMLDFYEELLEMM